LHNPNVEHHLGDTGIDGVTVWRCRLDLPGSGYGPVAGSCEYDTDA